MTKNVGLHYRGCRGQADRFLVRRGPATPRVADLHDDGAKITALLISVSQTSRSRIESATRGSSTRRPMPVLDQRKT
jgi:hypothetical protein